MKIMNLDTDPCLGSLFVVLIFVTSTTHLASADNRYDPNDLPEFSRTSYDPNERVDYLSSKSDEEKAPSPVDIVTDWLSGNRLFDQESLNPDNYNGYDPTDLLNLLKRGACDGMGLNNGGCNAGHASRAVAKIKANNDVGGPGKRSGVNRALYDYLYKRSCRIRLGGHCLTESLDKAARKHRFLKSADSPGRRRRSASQFLNVLRSKRR